VVEEEKKENEAASQEPQKEKGPANQEKTTAPVRPTECAACAKALKKRIWYYRNGKFFCNKKCFKRKEEEEQKKNEKETAN